MDVAASHESTALQQRSSEEAEVRNLGAERLD